MGAPGFHDETVLFDGTTTSTSYIYSTVLDPAATNNKLCAFIKQTAGAGITTAEYKFQQASSPTAAAADWYTLPIDNIGSASISTDTPPEFYIQPLAWTQSFPGNDPTSLGPFELTIGKPFFRVAFKITGAGTLTTKITISRILL